MLGQNIDLGLRPRVLLALFVVFACLLYGNSFEAVAQKSTDQSLGFTTTTQNDILLVGNNIKTKNLVTRPISPDEFKRAQDLPKSQRLIEFRRLASAVVMERREEVNIASLLQTYSKEAKLQNSKRDITIANLYMDYLQVRDLGPSHPNAKRNLKRIIEAKSSPDWFVEHRSHVLHAALLVRQRDYNSALKELDAGAKVIPTQVDALTRAASYEQSLVLAFAYGTTGNATAMIDAVENLIVQGTELDEPIDGVMHFNNLIYLSVKWHEFELSAELSRMMLSMPSLSDHDKAIGYLRLSQSLNRVEKFEEAYAASEEGLALNPTDNWKINLQIERAIALAGMGDVEGARIAVKNIQSEIETHPRFANMFQKSFLKIEALIARASDDPEKVYTILVQHNQIDMQRQLKSNERSNNSYLQALQKSEAITREREATQRAQLEAVTMERDNRTKQLAFTVLVTVLLAVFTAIGMYLARFYKKTSRENAHLRDLALTGERSKSEFLAVMSHELRTPLNGIIGLSDVLSREAEDKDVKFKSSVIMRSGLTLLDLLTNILDMSKMERGQLTINPAPMAIRDLIDGLRELWLPKAKAQGLTLTLHVDDNVPEYILLDNMRLRQCAENLISNAIKFTKSGRVHVHVTSGKADKAGQFTLTFIVADTGRGMSKDQIDTVFEPFTQADTSITREYGGSGLGMAITRSLARLMDGDVTVSSREGRGSEFTLTVKTQAPEAPNITADKQAPLLKSTKTKIVAAENTEQGIFDRAQRLEKIDAAIHAANAAANLAVKPAAQHDAPLDKTPASLTPEQTDETHAANIAEQELQTTRLPVSPAELSPTPPSPEAPPVEAVPTPKSTAHSADPFRGLKILIAEDIVSNQDILKVFLKPVGSIVTCVANGQEAVHAVTQNNFDLVLMDIRMPIMNGIEATAKIRALQTDKAAIPIIALTADASAENNAKCMAAGANVFLTKPVVAAELFGSIRFVLKQAEQQRQRRRA